MVVCLRLPFFFLLETQHNQKEVVEEFKKLSSLTPNNQEIEPFAGQKLEFSP